MKRIDTATREVDKHGAGKDGFRAGDPVNNERPTDLNEDWFDGVQEELANVIEDAGITLDGGDLAQLLAALAQREANFIGASHTWAGTQTFTNDVELGDAGTTLVYTSAPIRTRVLNLTDWTPSIPAGWSHDINSWNWTTIVNSSNIILNPRLLTGDAITEIGVPVYQFAAASSTPIELEVYKLTLDSGISPEDPVETLLGSAQYTAGSGAWELLKVDLSGSPETLGTSIEFQATQLMIQLRASDNAAGSFGDKVGAAYVKYFDAGLKNY